MIVDAHAHIFSQVQGRNAAGPTCGAGYGRVRIGDQTIQLLPPFCAETLFTVEMLIAQMDWAGVDKAVLLQGPFYGECNAYVQETLHRHQDRLWGAAAFDPWLPDSRTTFDAIDLACFHAVKLECSEATGLCGLHPHAQLDAPDLAWLWSTLEGQRKVLVFDLGTIGSRSYQTDAVRKIAAAHPTLKIVIAHLGQPTPGAEADPARWQLWLKQIRLGHLPNIWFDTAALPAYLPNEQFPYPSAIRYVQRALDEIGPAKILWGSDVPGLLGHATYPQLVQQGERALQSLTPDEQEMVFASNALHVFG